MTDLQGRETSICFKFALSFLFGWGAGVLIQSGRVKGGAPQKCGVKRSSSADMFWKGGRRPGKWEEAEGLK